jgi:hypothetical protein
VKKRVYIETTIVSYLTAKPSRDLIRMAHQEITREWWDGRRAQHNLCVSQFVLDEAGDGDAEAAAQRIKALRGLPLLAVTNEVRELAKALVKQGLLPKTAATDAPGQPHSRQIGAADHVPWGGDPQRQRRNACSCAA